MFEQNQDPGSLRPQELEAIYAISRAVARAVDTEPILDEIIRLVRSVFIFDNMVVYMARQDKTLEPTYARAIGRGRFREAELAWGESIAIEAFQTRQTIIRQEIIPVAGEVSDDRTSLRFFLGLPLNLGEEAVGALVFIRFGGPIYSPDHIHLAEFIATHVAQLIGRRQLVDRVASLEAQRKLDNLQDGFIAMITHELLTPLGFIKGYATTLLREDTKWDDATRKEFLTIIDEESDRLRELIDNLMDSSRLQAGTLRMTFQPVKLDTFLRDIALRAKTRAEPINVNLELQETGLQIQADPTRLAQIFDNLMGNAAKYAPGSLIELVLDTQDQMARIQVCDHGPGIEQEHLEHLFKRFYRVPGKSTSLRGTGLGLFICRQIAQAHHGDIKVESKVGEGTTFTILLPINENHAEEVSFAREAQT